MFLTFVSLCGAIPEMRPHFLFKIFNKSFSTFLITKSIKSKEKTCDRMFLSQVYKSFSTYKEKHATACFNCVSLLT